MPSDNLNVIVGKVNPALVALRSKFRGDELVHRGVLANVHQSARDLLEHSPILKKAVAEGELTLIKGVYDLESGVVVSAE